MTRYIAVKEAVKQAEARMETVMRALELLREKARREEEEKKARKAA